MNLLALQWNLRWHDREANYSRVRELLEEVGEADLIVLPEMFASGFSMNVEATAEPDPSPTEGFLKEIASARGSAVMGGLARRLDGGSCANELIAFGPGGGELVRYRKMRTFRLTGEHEHYLRGAEVALFDWAGGRIAPFICYDLRFPELFRQATRQGAEAFLVIASWPSVRVEHWLALLRARAIENLAYVVGVNRTGSDPNFTYPGRSVVFDPKGELIADAGGEEGTLAAVVDWSAVRQWRSEFPALQDLEN